MKKSIERRGQNDNSISISRCIITTRNPSSLLYIIYLVLFLLIPSFTLSSSRSSCMIDDTGRWSGVTVRLLALEEARLPNLYARAAEFSNATGATIKISQLSQFQLPDEVFADAGAGGPRAFDGYTIKGNWIPDLVEAGGLASLTDLVEVGDLWTDVDWTDIVPVLRDSICVYANQIYSMPIDADYVATAARDDLLTSDEGEVLFDESIFDTWEGWISFAEYHHGRDLNGDGIPDYGACIVKGENNIHYTAFAPLWAIAAPYLQRHGLQSGAFFDSETFDPLRVTPDGEEHFEKALELFKRLVKVTKPGVVLGVDSKTLFQEGRCATWMDLPGFLFGVQDTGGVNAKNYTGATMKRYPPPGVLCDSMDECPFAEEINTTSSRRLINRAPFFATSGLSLAISSTASPSIRQLLFELFTYMTAKAQSNHDVTLRTSFSDPFRQSQLGSEATYRLVNINGWNKSVAEDYHRVVSKVLNADNAALDLRVPGMDTYQSVALVVVGPYVYGDDDNATTISSKTAVENLVSAWRLVPVEVFPGSSEEAATKTMLSFYRAQLGLPPIIQDIDNGGFNIHAFKVSVAVLGGFVCAIMIIGFGIWVRRTIRRKKQLEADAAALIEQQVHDAMEVVKDFQFPLVLMRSDEFIKMGRLQEHEEMRNAGLLTFMDTMGKFDHYFKNKYVGIFFSHQWCAFTDPDPDMVQYQTMCSAVKEIAREEKRSLEEVYVWVDYFSIPQGNRHVQRLAILSLPALASILEYFVAICPPTNNRSTGEKMGKDSYLTRCWIRAEIMSFWSRNGDQNMYYAETRNRDNVDTNGSGGNNDTNVTHTIPVLRQLKPETGQSLRHISQGDNRIKTSRMEAIRVFEGELTCCRLQHNNGTIPCDKEELMLPILGLYGEIYSKRMLESVKPIHDAIESDLERIFPSTIDYDTGTGCSETRVLFGDLIQAIRRYVEIQEGVINEADVEFGKMVAGGSVVKSSVKHGSLVKSIVKHGSFVKSSVTHGSVIK